MLGEKIRRRRNEVGMSMKELSEMIGLSSGFISQIEREIAEPSITSLRKIAEALNMPIYNFFIEESSASRVVRRDESQQVIFPNAKVTYKLLSPDLNRQMKTLLGIIEPGESISDTPIAYMGEEVIYILEGEMFISVGIDEFRLSQGDTIFYYANIPHRITNSGDVTLKYISTTTPPRF